MVFGGVAHERLQLNEDTIWAGAPYDPSSPEARQALGEVRRLIFAGRYREASELAGAHMMAHPLRQPSYQTVGDLILDLAPSSYCEDYRRDLNLDTAIATTRYRQGGATLTREAFASPTDQVIVVSLRGDGPGYGRAYRYLEANGLLIGGNDLWIAATALAHELPVVTRNAAHFGRVPGLEVLSYAG
jgi:alpha-L-fucosidase 2